MYFQPTLAVKLKHWQILQKISIANFKSNYLTPAKKSIEKVINKSGDALDKVSDVLTSSTVTDDIEEALNSAQKK